MRFDKSGDKTVTRRNVGVLIFMVFFVSCVMTSIVLTSTAPKVNLSQVN